jgi:outer membrane protein assembly factor BamB
MKKLLGAMALVVLAVTGLQSQQNLRTLTFPKVPTGEILDRLNLTVAWRTRLPTAGLRDGLITLQLLPAKNRTELVVQTNLGGVFMLDAETGDPLWHNAFGNPKWSGQPVGYNERNIFVTRREFLYVLNRTNGAQRVYAVAKDTKLPSYGFQLPAVPDAAPRADGGMIFFAMGHRVQGYLLPNWDEAEAGVKGTAAKELSVQERQDILEMSSALAPVLLWSFHQADIYVEQPLLITPGKVALENVELPELAYYPKALISGDVTAVTTAGAVLSFNKIKRSKPDEFRTNGNVTAPMAQHGPIAYVGSEDYTLYALDTVTLRLVWRFLVSAPILTKPEVTDRDVFVVGHRKGLYRVDRGSGRAVWLNQQADRFLSTNQRYVYALDPSGMLLVLDYARGTTLAQYDMREWIFSVPNHLNDRFYLAANDGQILCLRNRAEKLPVVIRAVEIKTPPKKDEAPKSDEMPAKDKDDVPAKDVAPPKDDGAKKVEAPKKEEMKKDDLPKKEDMKEVPKDKGKDMKQDKEAAYLEEDRHERIAAITSMVTTRFERNYWVMNPERRSRMGP